MPHQAEGSRNLFSMLHELTGTTDQILAHTQSLHQEVEKVQTKLGQMHEQEAVLAQQKQTGEQLARELARQEELTAQGVSLMGNILEREKQSAVITKTVAGQVAALTHDVGRNADLLGQMVDPLEQSRQQSERLNGQLDELLREMGRSQQSFQLFGKAKDLLSKLVPGLPGIPTLPSLPIPSLPSVPSLPTPSLPTPSLPVPSLPVPGQPTPTLPPILPLPDPLKKLFP